MQIIKQTIFTLWVKIIFKKKKKIKKFDFVVDHEHVAETTKILDMHRYLITKHSIIS